MSGFSSGRVAKAICDRCKTKRDYIDLRPDGDKSGLRVCSDGCWDRKDPWRLPRPTVKPITIRYPRPDVQLTIPSNDSLTDEMGPPVRNGPSQPD